MDNDIDFGEYDRRFQLDWDTNLVTYNDQGQQDFFYVNDKPYILLLIYDMVENDNSTIFKSSIQGKAYVFLEKYNLKDAYDAYKGIFKEKTNAILKNSQAHFNEEVVTKSNAPASSANGGRRSKRSHRKTRKGKSRKHRSKGGRRGKSRKH